MDALIGFEPMSPDSKSGILPLDDRALEPHIGIEPNPPKSQLGVQPLHLMRRGAGRGTRTPNDAGSKPADFTNLPIPALGLPERLPLAADFSTPAVSQQTFPLTRQLNWSVWKDSNLRSLHSKCSTLPTKLHTDITGKLNRDFIQASDLDAISDQLLDNRLMLDNINHVGNIQTYSNRVHPTMKHRDRGAEK